jgi:hypothetical protein
MVLSSAARLSAAGSSKPFRLPATNIIMRDVGLIQSSFAHYQSRALPQDSKREAYSSPYIEGEFVMRSDETGPMRN